MDLSQKQNVFTEFFLADFDSSLNFEHFQRKDDPHSLYISEIIHHERRA